MAQVAAIWVRELQDTKAKAEDDDQALRRAFVAHLGAPAFTELFANQIPDEQQVADIDEAFRPDRHGNINEVGWGHQESADFTAEDAEKFLDQLERSGGMNFSVSGAEMDEHSKRMSVEWGDDA